ncbi:MAG: response regulator, partial [Desulfotignum sp.]|nr:response regulator [Desulfotignum sp.]
TWGDITVTSALEKGSVFSFTIPLEHQPKKNQIVLQPPRDLRGLRVLIVDDNQTSLDILASIIRSFQMEAVTASSGKKALDILMTHPPDSPFDLVLLDWKMPGINGLEAARKIKLDMSLDKMPVVCMISAHAREDLIQQADRKFLDAFLHKPVNQSFLFDTIMELFGRHDALVTRKLGMDSPQTDPHFFDHLQGKQILLVEDNEINRDVAMEWLHNVGILVKVAKNGKEALVCLGIDGTNRENTALKPPDAVLMDIQMPDMDGLEATRHIRECARFQSLPIIAMTAHALKGDREKCIDAGMNDYITKPIDPNIMFQTLVQWTTPASEGHGKPFPASPKPALSTIPLPPSDQKQELDASVRGKKQSRPDVSATVLPEIELPGIDVALGLFRANHNRTLYHKLIKTFVRDFGDAETGIYALLSKDRVEPDDRDAARITVHSIKGVSANIGAEDLARAAAGLEQVLIAAHEFDLKNLFTTGIWSQFRTELRQVITGIRTYLSVAEKADEISNNTRAPEQKHRKELELDGGLVHTEPTVDVSELIKALERIDAMLDDDLGAARDELACIEKVLEDLVDKALFRNLMDAMDDFDIDDVSDIIRQMSRSLAQKMAPP